MRLGDDIDDYCSRCKRGTDHSVVTVAGEKVQKVRCRTCNYEHTYRHNKGGKKEMTKKEAFDQVLASVLGTQPVEEKKSGRKKKPDPR